jgi:hypothetical protein
MSVITSSYISQAQKIDFIGADRAVFKKGDIFLNGKRIHIDTTLNQTVRNINKRTIETGVKASIEKGSTGVAKLVLTSRGSTLTINDPNKILLPFSKNNQVGRGSDKFIQVIGDSAANRNVAIRYISQNVNTTEINNLKLTPQEAVVKKQVRHSAAQNVVPAAVAVNPPPAVVLAHIADAEPIAEEEAPVPATPAAEPQPAAVSRGRWSAAAYLAAVVARAAAAALSSLRINPSELPSDHSDF